MPLNIGETFAGFRIIRLLGSGGMGEVYLAQHPRLPRRDALRVLPKEWSAEPEYRERFRREAELASTLWHPSIAGVHGRGEHDGQLWISMAFVDGNDLGSLLKQRHPDGLPREQVVTIITAVAGALDYAHNHGLLHGNVKPANIIVTDPDRDADRRVVLTDFGVARNFDDCTADYAAPEQLMSTDFGGRADQYALACTAYQLLTGVQLFAHANPAVVISRHLNSRSPAAAETLPELAALDPVLAKGLDKNPADRFASCGGFAHALAAEAAAPPAAASTLAPAGPAPVSGRQTAAVPDKLRGPRGPQPPWMPAATIAAVCVVIAATVGMWQLRPSHGAAPSGQPSPPPTAATVHNPNVTAIPSAGGPTLEGLYRLDYDNPRATLNSNPWPAAGNQVASYWWAFRSTCKPSGCVATATRVDDTDHNAPFPEGGGMTAVFRFINASWQGDPARGSLPCEAPSIGQTQAMDTSLALTPQPGGGLAGIQTTTIESNECALQGAVITVPVQASKVGDAPPGNLIADPATVVDPPAAGLQIPPPPPPAAPGIGADLSLPAGNLPPAPAPPGPPPPPAPVGLP